MVCANISDCWSSSVDVHGHRGTPSSKSTLKACLEECESDQSCLAVDWESDNPHKKTCWKHNNAITQVVQHTEMGKITHHELDRACLSKSHFCSITKGLFYVVSVLFNLVVLCLYFYMVYFHVLYCLSVSLHIRLLHV